MYNSLKKTITINLLDFNYFDTKNYHTKWHIVEDTDKEKMLTDVLEIHFIEIPKFIKKNKLPENKKEEWLYFIDYSNEEMVEMSVEKNKKIEMAQDELDYLTGDEATRRLAELKEKWILDYNSGITSAVEQGLRDGLLQGREQGLQQGREQGLQQGIEQGLKQGEKEEKLEIAKKMLIKGLDIKLIIDITELSIDEIEEIKNSINQ